MRRRRCVRGRIGQAFVAWEMSCGIGYHKVDDEIVWNTIKDELPPMRKAIVKALKRITPSTAKGKPDVG